MNTTKISPELQIEMNVEYSDETVRNVLKIHNRNARSC